MNLRLRLPSWTCILAALVLLAIPGCCHLKSEPPLQRFSYAELHMASIFRIVLYAPDQKAADHAAETVYNRINALENIMTDYDPKSELMQLCRGPVGVPQKTSDDLFAILKKSQEISKESGGAFDITVGPFIALWRQAKKTRVLPTPEAIAATEQSVGYKKLILDEKNHTVTLTAPGMKLDLGGIAKGLTAEEALKVLRRLGIDRAMVAASGDIALGNPPPGKKGWEIGIASIDHPLQGLTEEVQLANVGISTSGDTEQYVEIGGRRYSHIVDPVTGLGLTERIGVTIIARTGTESDALATAACVLGAQKGLACVEKHPGAAALVVELTPTGTKVTPSHRFKKYSETALKGR
jgi:thiamine biosynthesis lipoprotein